MTTRAQTPRTTHRSAGGLCMVGAALLTVLAVTEIGSAVGPPVPGIDPWMGLAALGIVLTGAGVLETARARLAGPGPLATTGAVVALLGTLVFVVAHVLAFLDGSRSDSPIFPVGQVLQAVGMVVLGIAVLWGHRWTGPGRVTPLVCGLYPVLVLIPVFAVSGAPNFVAIAGYGLTWLAFGAALASTRTDETPLPEGIHRS
ncbi:hypothetical protein [Actinomycetospora termitidis]|uniref:Integral membrane protein n=1 Tax=Actinomycetospora termitidis TaxID=3053470 RepID=A0ABT7MEE4_9PSEU|nr:hypothetical protein [Actinomycetospora sp. Odt1-22]MDL5158267.1 hypothetical protein [Actinomycetospora sp. Odt1-22]